MTSTHRQRLLIFAAGTVIGLFVLDRIVISPLIRHWTARTTEIATLRKSIAAGTSLIERADRTQEIWTEIQEGSLPIDPATAEQTVLTSFDQWGRTSRIEIASIKPQWKRGANSRYSLLECRVDANGSLANLVRLLYEVEKSPLALRIDSVELTGRDDQGQRLSVGLTVSGLRLAPLGTKL